MSRFSSNPTLEAGERIVWHDKAKLSLPGEAVGGTLYLTNCRLLHVPGRLSRGRQARAWRLQDITSVYGAQARDQTIYRDLRPDGGPLSRRVNVRLQDGSAVLFLIKRRDEALAELQRGTSPQHSA